MFGKFHKSNFGNVFRYLAVAALLVCPLKLGAQGLPRLKQADEVSTGVLPNGIMYYLVENPVVKGRADFALVQEGIKDVSGARNALVSLPHISPFETLSRSCVPYTQDGYVAYDSTARVFRFPDVDITSRTKRDSVLLVLTDLMSLSMWEQTVIVSGDISAGEYVESLHTLSLMIPRVKPVARATSEASFVAPGNKDDNVPFEFKINKVRVGREQAGTPVPLVSEMLERELGYIVTDRITRQFTIDDIPFWMDNGSEFIKVHVPDSVHAEAINGVSRVLGDIVNGKVTQQEFIRAKNISLDRLAATGLVPGKSNAFYVDRCVSAVRFGTHLASRQTIENFFSRRRISLNREMELFNNFAKAHIGENWDVDKLSRGGYAESYTIFSEVLKTKTPRPVKLAGSTTDPVSGGALWTFSNRIKVIYKKDTSTDGVRFCLALRGGASSVEGIRPGESAYLSDMFAISRVAGFSGGDFRKMLNSEGIDLSGEVTLEDMRITGSSPSESVENLLKALVKVAYSRELDMKAFEYYKKCHIVKNEVSAPPVYAVMDSLICPDYAFLDKSSPYNISTDFPLKAEEYFNRRFSNVADGIFVFVGNIEEDELLSLLCKYLGCFRTSRMYALRERVPYNLHSGRNTYIVQGRDKSVNMAATALVSATKSNYYAFLVAQEAVRQHFASELAPLGMYAEVTGKMDFSPVERVTLYVTCRPCPQDGLPAGIDSSSPLDALREVRMAFAGLPHCVLDNDSLGDYKAIVKNNLARELSTQEGLIRYCLCRYSEGKDLTSDYAAGVDALVEDDLLWILEELTDSGVVEYIVD